MQQPLQQLGALKSAAGGLTGAVSLMTLCTAHLGLLVTQHGRQPASLQAAADTLRLLLLWLHACPPAVSAFLRSVAQSQPFLVDSIRGSNACSAAVSSAHPLTRGMLALLLGLCASYAEEGAGTPTQQQLLGAIDQQIGLRIPGCHGAILVGSSELFQYRQQSHHLLIGSAFHLLLHHVGGPVAAAAGGFWRGCGRTGGRHCAGGRDGAAGRRPDVTGCGSWGSTGPLAASSIAVMPLTPVGRRDIMGGAREEAA